MGGVNSSRVGLPGDLVLTFPDDVSPMLETSGSGPSLISVTVPAGSHYDVHLEAPLGLGVGLWCPDLRNQRTLPPDWAGSQVTSLVGGAPLIALYDADATALWGVACSQLVEELQIEGGVSEEHKQVLLHLRSRELSRPTTITLAVATEPAPLAARVGDLADWMAASNAISPLPLPDQASEPVWSTWYTYTQDVNHDKVIAEGRLAARLGCGTVFIDDGWQVGGHGRGYGGTGDWVPDQDKFGDLRATVNELTQLGLGTVLWIAPLLLGHQSAAYAELSRFAPDGMPRLNCQVLDPRHAEVREFAVQTCRRVVTENGAAGLKIDFLNNAMTYQGTESTGDIADVGEAMRVMLADLRAGLAEDGLQDAIIEFRQPYVSPAITAYGNCLRVGDCPADAWQNRTSSIDLRMFVRGAVVHADPLMWAPEAGAEAVAQQFLATFFSVPQVSMPLAQLSAEQSAAVAHHLSLWSQWKQVALHGSMAVSGVELGYPQASATHDRRAVVGLSRPELVDLDALDADEVLLLNDGPAQAVLVRAAGWTIARRSAPDGSTVDDQSTPVLDAGLAEVAVPAFGTLLLTRATALQS